MLKKILLALIFVITAITSVTHAEDDMKTVASKAYVDTKIETKQLKIPAAGQPNVGAGETVMTYTATGNGQIGERGLYSDISSYDANTDGDKLITASALNATFTNLPTTPTTKLECANSPACTLWTIVDQTAYDILPAGYTRLEYIESTGTQYINTNINGSTNAVIDMQGTARSNETVVFMLVPINATTYRNGFGQYRDQIAGAPSFDIATRRIYNVSYTSDSLTVNGITNSSFYIANNANLGLFGSAATSGRRIANAKLYSAKIYNNDTLLRNFIPAKNPNNVIGMYDTVSGQFFTNSGSGDFTPGPTVN